jgi:hypothetical protein
MKKNYYKVGFIISITVSIFIISFFSFGGDLFWHKPTPPKIIEKVKYVEKEGMETKDFIEHLNPRIDPIIAEKIGDAIDEYSKKYQLPRKLILSIIYKESTFNPLAKSNVAFGLMQIYPKFHPEKIKALGIKDQRKLYHIDTNINIGCQIFREYFDASKGDLDETFHKYLSKKATKEQRDKYKNRILNTWSEMDLYEYLTKRKKNEKGEY